MFKVRILASAVATIMMLTACNPEQPDQNSNSSPNANTSNSSSSSMPVIVVKSSSSMSSSVITSSSSSISNAPTSNNTAPGFNGYVLYNPLNSKQVFMKDGNGNTVKTWGSDKQGNYAALLKDNGNVVRGIVDGNSRIGGPAVAGGVEELDANGVVWRFTYASNDHRSHHDITLIGDNVLITAWRNRTKEQMAAAGQTNPSAKLVTHLVEVAQDGKGGKIVWEWDLWDHMIQDTDPSKPNYGVISENPQLMDINISMGGSRGFGGGGFGGDSGIGKDWFHVNGVNYNAELDQIVFSSRYASEIYVIDHSTTTAEAASHSGGKAGKGGDFLFRWGNPSNWGGSGQKIITSAVHDPRWIKPGRPDAGFISFFNNSGNNKKSSIDAINPTMDGYNYPRNGNTWGPATYDYRHNALVSASGQSSHERMSNGNQFVNASNNTMYEVDTNGKEIFRSNTKTAKAFRYECEHPGIVKLMGDKCKVSN